MMYQICTLLTKVLCILLFLSRHISAIAPLPYESSKPPSEPVSFTLTFDSNTDAASYGNFIESLRKAVTGQSSPTLYSAFRVLPNPSLVKDSEQFVLVKLTNNDKESITLAINVTDLYVVGYQTGDASFFFKDYKINKAPYDSLFKNTKTRQSLPFGGGYPDLVKHVPRATGERVGLDTIKLGISELHFGIKDLTSKTTSGSQNFRARPLIVMIEMVSEATRFGYFEREILNMIKGSKSSPPSAASLELENNWETLSRAIQQAVEGRFQKPVELFGQTFYSVNAELKATVTVLKYVSKSKNLLMESLADI